MFYPGDIISYIAMCEAEGVSLQRGMNFRLKGSMSVILMSIRPGAPYADRVEENGRILIYEGHDAPRSRGGSDPKQVDQPRYLPSGRPTQNGLFFDAAKAAVRGKSVPERVKVYEKIRNGVWSFDGVFELLDAWEEEGNKRQVFKFKLKLLEDSPNLPVINDPELPHNRLIPTSVKIAVWKRDGGKCVVCKSSKNLHFDHIIPYSQGGSSLVAENIQLLCAKHNLQKHDQII